MSEAPWHSVGATYSSVMMHARCQEGEKMRFAIPVNFPVVYTDDRPARVPCVRVASHPIEIVLTFPEGVFRFAANRDAAR